MTVYQPPDHVTPLGEKLLEVVRGASGSWVNRRYIAVQLGRPTRLTPHDVNLLQVLVDEGLIEISRKSTGPVRTEYIYRAGKGQ